VLAALPSVVLPPESDINNVGIWTWANGLRTLIPWNVPLLAGLIYCTSPRDVPLGPLVAGRRTPIR